MNAALYIRVSTEDQTEYSPDAQKRLLYDYAKKHDLFINEEHIFMESISGRKAEKRPEFQNMIALARSKHKPFQKILVWKFSRFARNQEESIVYKNMLKRDGVEVISVSEPIIDGPFGSLIERIIEWMDEYYSVRLSGEVTRGMTEKALRGKLQYASPYGYNISNGNVSVVDNEADIVKLIFTKFVDENMTYVEIGHYLNNHGLRNRKGNMFSSRIIKYAIQNPIYAGIVRWNYATQQGSGRKIKPEDEWILRDGTHEAIISKAMFEKAQEKVKYINSLYTKSKIPPSEYGHWLGGLVRCSDCGGTLTLSNGKLKFGGYYTCNKNRKGSCPTSNRIRVDELQQIVIDGLKDLLLRFDTAEGLPIQLESKPVSDNEAVILQNQLERIRRKYEVAKNAYLAEIDTIDEYKSNKESIQQEEDKVLKKLNSLSAPTDKQDKKILKQRIENSIALLEDDSVDIKTKNDMLKTFITQIVVDKKSDTIDMKYYLS